MEDVAASTRAYQLSTVLCAHSDDVKCVYPIDSDCILSASRDRTVGVWKRKQESKVGADGRRWQLGADPELVSLR